MYRSREILIAIQTQVAIIKSHDNMHVYKFRKCTIKNAGKLLLVNVLTITILDQII